MDGLLKKMMSKKKDCKMNDAEKAAKLKAITGMKDMAEEAMSEGLSGLKKVTVAADSEEGLKEGLKKAEEVVADVDDLDEDEAEDSDEELALSEDEIDEKIKELMALKEKMKA